MKHRLNLLIDVLAYLVMVGLTGTGALIAFRLPPGSRGNTVAGLGRHDWGDIHFYLAIALLALVALHIILHWRWVTNSLGVLFRRRGSQKLGAGVGGSIVLILCAVLLALAVAFPWFYRVREGAAGEGYHGGHEEAEHGTHRGTGQGQGRGREQGGEPDGAGRGKHGAAVGDHGDHDGHDHGIRGRTTFAEAAKLAGVPVARLLEELGLPADTPPADRFGRHGFRMDRMDEVRALIERLRKESGSPTP